MSLSVGWPLALVALVLCPALLLLGRRSRYHASRGRMVAVATTRVLSVALVVLAIADLRLTWPTDDLSVTAVVDGSSSVPEAAREDILRQLSEVRSARPDVEWQTLEPGDDPLRTELAPAIGLAVATAPSDRVRRILLASDGRDETGDVQAAILAARRAGVEVSVLPLGASPPLDAVAVSDVEAPRLVRAGETVDVAVTLSAGTDARVKLRASVDGDEVSTEEVAAKAGTEVHHVAVRFPEDEGVHVLEVRAEAPGDVIADNDSHRTLVRVLSHPRVLLVHDGEGDPPALQTVLSDARLTVEPAGPAEVPTETAAFDRYALVVLDEIDPGDLSEEQQRALRGFVEELGGGLVDVTGTHAVRRTPSILREIEPVEPPPAIPEPRPLELVLVIDRSSSMDGRPIAQARQAGVAAIRALREDALVGVVAFSGSADYVMAPVPHDRFGEATAFVSRIVSGGGTDIAAALGAARRIMSSDDRYIHHVILLSDGESDPAPALAQAQALAGSGVTISAITLGPYSQLMSQIARIGRGRYHVTRNAGSLPSLFVREAQYRQPPAHKQVRFVPEVDAEHPMLEGIDFGGGPPLYGHTLGETKRGATRLLGTPDGNALLAHWHVGLGQVATFCSSTTGGWANEWRGWPGFRALWSQAAWSMLRGRTVEPLDVRVREVFHEPGLREVLVAGPTVASEPAPTAHLFRGREGEAELALAPAGPGLWRAAVPVESGFLVEARMPSDPEPTAAAGADAPYPRELARFGPDLPRLDSWAALGGGRVLERPGSIADRVDPRAIHRSLRTLLLTAALVLYLLGLLLLRLPDRAAVVTLPASARPPKEPRDASTGFEEAA